MCMNNAKPFPMNETFETGVHPDPSHTFRTMGVRLLRPDFEIYSRKLRGALLTALAYDPSERWEVEEYLALVETVLEHWSFGDEDDLFLGDTQGDGQGWGGRYPDLSWYPDEGSGMTVIDPEATYLADISGYQNPPGWDNIEDEEDFAGVRLLFPSRTDIRKGYREMPFEEGQAEIPKQVFGVWRTVGEAGKPKSDLESEDGGDKEEEEKSKSITSKEDSSDSEDKLFTSQGKSVKSQRKSEPRKIAGMKRMRSASEQEEGENADSKSADDPDRFRFSHISHSRKARKRLRRESPKKTPTPFNLEYFANYSETIVQSAARSTPKEVEGEDILERSAPWIPVQPFAPSQIQDEWDYEETEGWDEG